MNNTKMKRKQEEGNEEKKVHFGYKGQCKSCRKEMELANLCM
jgi:hypothetical protein